MAAELEALEDRLLEKECFVVDYLPRQVDKDQGGCYFDVEAYLLNGPRRAAMAERFVNVILKLLCYFPCEVLRSKWPDRPKPEQVDRAVREIVKKRRGTLHCLFPGEDMLLEFDGDLYLTVYGPPEGARDLLAAIARSDGLFWRPADT